MLQGKALDAAALAKGMRGKLLHMIETITLVDKERGSNTIVRPWFLCTRAAICMYRTLPYC
jgi:hypothetical protein